MLKINSGKADMATNEYGLDANYMRSKLNLLARDAGHYRPDEMARALARLVVVADASVLQEPEFAAAPRPEAVQQSDSLIYSRECDGGHTFPCNPCCEDSGYCKTVKAGQQTEPRPVPTSDRLPTEADADPWGNVFAFSIVWDMWVEVHWRRLLTERNKGVFWRPTGLVRPAEVKP